MDGETGFNFIFVRSGRNSGEFLYSLRSETAPAIISPRRYTDAIGVDLHTLANWSRVPEIILSQTPSVERVQRYLRDSLRAIQVGSDIADDIDKAVIWFKDSRISAFGNKTAQSLVSEGRVEDVVDYLLSIETGFAG